MKKTNGRREKLIRFKEQTLFALLDGQEQQFLEDCFWLYHLTFQEFRQLVEAARDLQMWGESSLRQWWESASEKRLGAAGSVAAEVLGTRSGAGDAINSGRGERNAKEQLLQSLHNHLHQLKSQPKSYVGFTNFKSKSMGKIEFVDQQSDKSIFGYCPVASEKTVCCNLRTIDSVETCAFGCSYCTIQTFYSDKVVFEGRLKEKLQDIRLDPNRRYHIGTGQSSDALVWGNHNGMLDHLCDFARRHPNALLEFKTKSANIAYFLDNDLPPNILCSWSLNPQTIIDHEEHFTISLKKRLTAARQVAERGVKVAFHFHPIIIYDGWREEYPAIARQIMDLFQPNEVLFVSFGSVTFIKPVIKEIRRKGLPTRILQMELVADPHGKLTYPDEIKIEKFRLMYQTFQPWRKKVFFYLCMEKPDIWKETLGFVYGTNEEFEQALLKNAFEKIGRSL